MFGYINANQKEMTEENKKAYHAYYCGLCQKLKQNSGRAGQMLLNYDMTFLILLLTGLYELDDQTCQYTCPRHPKKKQEVWMNEATKYAADMNVLLSYHNCMDDWKDNRNVPKKIVANLLQDDYNRIRGKYPRQAKAVEHYISELSVMEKRKESNVDMVAGLTGEMLGELFCWKEDEWQEELRCLGFYMGKFIYLMDAYEDLEKDKKKSQYNVLLYTHIERPREYETYCRLLLTSMMAECAKSFERLPIIYHADIMRNILYSGVWTKYELIQLKKKNREKRGKKSDESL